MSKQQFKQLASNLFARLCFSVAVLLLSACAKYEYHASKAVDIQRVDEVQDEQISENELLDVGIVVFDPGLDLLDDESVVYSNVRESEAVWFSSQLKKTLEYSNAWGVVRALPKQNTVMDLIVAGKILESNGEVLSLQIDAVDASGRQWLSKKYFQRSSAYVYHPEIKTTGDPFQSLFNEIANDLYDIRQQSSAEELTKLRNLSKIRFAQDFAPDAFADFVVKDKKGQYQLQRIPAANDPMMKRVERIQARNDLFLDVVQDYYRSFNREMEQPYQQWRKLSYKEVLYERQLKAQARKEKIAGIAAILVGVLAQGSSNRGNRAAGQVAILGGAQVFRSGYAKADEAVLHSETLRELGESLEAELEPSVIDLKDRSVTLSGTVDDQFREWREILAKMFAAEQGIGISDDIDVLPNEERIQQQLDETLSNEVDNASAIENEMENKVEETTEQNNLPQEQQ